MTSITNNPLVSVVIPVFNGQASVEEALASILNQSYSNLDVIVIDDGSSDNTAQILGEQRDPRLRILSNPVNQGLGFSLNRGLREARGQYIAIMHADDISMPDRIRRQVDYLEAHPEIGICGGQINKLLDGKRYRVPFPLHHDDIFADLLFYAPFAHPAVMSRRDLYVTHGLTYREDCDSVEDYEMWTRVLQFTKGANLREVLLEYKCHSLQISARKYNQSEALKRPHLKKMLALVGVPASDEECMAHSRWSLAHDTFTRREVLDGRAWLNRIYHANLSTRVVAPRALRRTLNNRWARVCSQAEEVGFSTFLVYLDCSFVRLASKDAFKLFCKSILASARRLF